MIIKIKVLEGTRDYKRLGNVSTLFANYTLIIYLFTIPIYIRSFEMQCDLAEKEFKNKLCKKTHLKDS